MKFKSKQTLIETNIPHTTKVIRAVRNESNGEITILRGQFFTHLSRASKYSHAKIEKIILDNKIMPNQNIRIEKYNNKNAYLENKYPKAYKKNKYQIEYHVEYVKNYICKNKSESLYLIKGGNSQDGEGWVQVKDEKLVNSE